MHPAAGSSAFLCDDFSLVGRVNLFYRMFFNVFVCFFAVSLVSVYCICDLSSQIVMYLSALCK